MGIERVNAGSEPTVQSLGKALIGTVESYPPPRDKLREVSPDEWLAASSDAVI